MAPEPKNADNSATRDSGRGPNVGSVLEGRYRLKQILGEGGIGTVFEAEHIRLNRPVAIKVLQEQFAVSTQMRERFDKEAKALAALSHPNIVAITDYGVARHRMPYLVMELLEGRNLRDVIDSGGRMDEGRALEITKQILRGLSYAHRVGIIHRDLKPGNVFLINDDDGVESVKILDFGFVKMLQDPDTTGSQLSRRGIPFGTVGYMPPEQLAGGETGSYSDVYTVGLLFYEMLTGQKPFSGSPVEVAQAHLSEPPPSVSHYCPGLEPNRELETCLNKAMAKEPEERFDDAVQLLDALENLPSPLLRQKDSATAATIPAISLEAVSEEIRNQTETSSEPALGKARTWRLPIIIIAFVAAIAVGTVIGLSGEGPTELSIGDTPSTGANVGGGRYSAPFPVDGGSSPVDGGPITGDGDLFDAAFAMLDGDFLSDEAFDRDSGTGGSDGGEDASTTGVADNPWKRRPLPRFLANSRRRVVKGGVLGPRAVRAVRRYARSNRTDPRPHLVLAQSYLNDGSARAAFERYELAYDFDKASRGDPRMLGDLVKLIEADSVGERAAELLITAFGREAAGAVDKALATRRLHPKARRRFRDVKARLAGQ